MDTSNTLFQELKNYLSCNDDVTYFPVQVQDVECTFIYIRSIVDIVMLQEKIIRPLLLLNEPGTRPFMEVIHSDTLFPWPMKDEKDPLTAAEAITAGSAVLIVNSLPSCMIFTIPKYQKRTVQESQNEQVVIGPRESFIEDVDVNLSLLRHKIRHPELKVVRYQIGRYTKTPLYVVYLEGLCDKKLLQVLDRQFKNIDVDGVLGVSFISEQFKITRKTSFPQFQYTERPDSVASAVLEGRVGILLEGTPSAQIVPTTLFSLLQSSEDYYQSFIYASWIRMVRFVFALVSVLLPALYVSISTFQPEIIPTDLLLTIAAARENIPFTALVEALLMELTFEALREAGTRIPKPVGQTISIIGAIVIGQAAVSAGVVSAPMVIVVSITGIAAFIVPHYELGLSLRLLRFALLILGGTMGLIGVLAATFIIYSRLCSLNTFGTPYMQPFAPIVFSEWRDMLFRAPSYMMTRRPYAFHAKNKRRLRKK
ncbi:spore germination protein [Paenibacillus lemnae]|uniref:Spore germination protein n=1 Tax=Paenibacillus lemnae TaxID=1330551 RepID=A0A848M5U3_PAELE|nr:spore germination protein [Paenibacillus lemnae]NMO95976.1 spore germination protein [Paenibacillus lemnae]